MSSQPDQNPPASLSGEQSHDDICGRIASAISGATWDEPVFGPVNMGELVGYVLHRAEQAGWRPDAAERELASEREKVRKLVAFAKDCDDGACDCDGETPCRSCQAEEVLASLNAGESEQTSVGSGEANANAESVQVDDDRPEQVTYPRDGSCPGTYVNIKRSGIIGLRIGPPGADGRAAELVLPEADRHAVARMWSPSLPTDRQARVEKVRLAIVDNARFFAKMTPAERWKLAEIAVDALAGVVPDGGSGFPADEREALLKLIAWAKDEEDPEVQSMPPALRRAQTRLRAGGRGLSVEPSQEAIDAAYDRIVENLRPDPRVDDASVEAVLALKAALLAAYTVDTAVRPEVYADRLLAELRKPSPGTLAAIDGFVGDSSYVAAQVCTALAEEFETFEEFRRVDAVSSTETDGDAGDEPVELATMREILADPEAAMRALPEAEQQRYREAQESIVRARSNPDAGDVVVGSALPPDLAAIVVKQVKSGAREFALHFGVESEPGRGWVVPSGSIGVVNLVLPIEGDTPPHASVPDYFGASGPHVAITVESAALRAALGPSDAGLLAVLAEIAGKTKARGPRPAPPPDALSTTRQAAIEMVRYLRWLAAEAVEKHESSHHGTEGEGAKGGRSFTVRLADVPAEVLGALAGLDAGVRKSPAQVANLLDRKYNTGTVSSALNTLQAIGVADCKQQPDGIHDWAINEDGVELWRSNQPPAASTGEGG